MLQEVIKINEVSSTSAPTVFILNASHCTTKSKINLFLNWDMNNSCFLSPPKYIDCIFSHICVRNNFYTVNSPMAIFFVTPLKTMILVFFIYDWSFTGQYPKSYLTKKRDDSMSLRLLCFTGYWTLRAIFVVVCQSVENWCVPSYDLFFSMLSLLPRYHVVLFIKKKILLTFHS